ncbi:MAG: TM1266 family iron-only hydrogenase system putative regulator [Christensenellaceae bacterium]
MNRKKISDGKREYPRLPIIRQREGEVLPRCGAYDCIGINGFARQARDKLFAFGKGVFYERKTHRRCQHSRIRPLGGESINELLSRYGEYILGRMGIPYREKNISVLSVVLDAPVEITNALTGRLGKLENVAVKALFENMREQRTKKEKKFYEKDRIGALRRLSAVFMATGCVSRERSRLPTPRSLARRMWKFICPTARPLWRWPNNSIGTGKGTRNIITL